MVDILGLTLLLEKHHLLFPTGHYNRLINGRHFTNIVPSETIFAFKHFHGFKQLKKWLIQWKSPSHQTRLKFKLIGVEVNTCTQLWSIGATCPLAPQHDLLPPILPHQGDALRFRLWSTAVTQITQTTHPDKLRVWESQAPVQSCNTLNHPLGFKCYPYFEVISMSFNIPFWDGEGWNLFPSALNSSTLTALGRGWEQQLQMRKGVDSPHPHCHLALCLKPNMSEAGMGIFGAP